MKLMIASDIHGDLECTERLVAAYRESGAERLLLLGDVLYHGPRNDLPTGYDPKGVISLLNSMADEIICVRGNCDTEVDQMVLDFPLLADYSYVMADGLCIFATHGHKYSRENPPKLKAGDVLLCGHTHIPAAEAFCNGNFYLNPGSVSIPKADSERGYILYEDREFTFCTLDGAVYDALELK
jgi:putative phosphoesterase